MTDKRSSDRRVREYFASELREERKQRNASRPAVDSDIASHSDALMVGTISTALLRAVDAMKAGKVEQSMELLRNAVAAHHSLFDDDTAREAAELITIADDRCVELWCRLPSLPPPPSKS